MNSFSRSVMAGLTMVFVVCAAVLAACGGSSTVANQSTQGFNRYPVCTQGSTKESIRQLPASCPSPPVQWGLIVANPGNNSVTSYTLSANGNPTPLATLSGSQTQLNGDYGIWYDGDTGDFFVSNENSSQINRYPINDLNGGQGGDLAPDQVLSGSQTLLNTPVGVTENYATTVPGLGDEPACAINDPAVPATPSVVAHLENASGNTAPLYSIAGNKTGLGGGQGLAVDSDSTSPNFGGIYVDVNTTTTHKIEMFLPSKQFPTPSPGQVINVAPYKVITGSLITDPLGLYCDVNGYLYVVNGSPAKILVYAPSATGNATPSNTITDATHLSSPYGVAVYTDLRVFVSNQGNNSIAVYNNGETGTSSLVQDIIGSNTDLNKPASLDTRISR